MKTGDQKFYTSGDHVKAEIDVYLTKEGEDAPSIVDCRHAVLKIRTQRQEGKYTTGYVIYDRLLSRIVNGVYYMPLEEVLVQAQVYNESASQPQDMAPNGIALGLKYPEIRKGKNLPTLVEERG